MIELTDSYVLVLGLSLNLVLSSIFVGLEAFGDYDECVQEVGVAKGLRLQNHRFDFSSSNSYSDFKLVVGAFDECLW